MLSLNSQRSLMFYRATRQDAYDLLLIRLLLKTCTVNHCIIKRGKILPVNSLLPHPHNLPTFCISRAGQPSLHDYAASFS